MKFAAEKEVSCDLEMEITSHRAIEQVLAYQVTYTIILAKSFQKYLINVIWVFFHQFSPLFSYKKETDGNYTFGGFLNEYIQAAKMYFNVL